MVLGIQVAGILFGCLMIYFTFLHYKRKQFTIKEYIFWNCFWILLMVVALFPNILDFFVKDILNLYRTLDFLVIGGFLFLIGALFYTYSIVRQTQKKVEEIVRKIAIEKKWK